MDINTFSMIMIGLGAVFFLVLLGYVIKRAFDRQTGEIGGWQFSGAGRTITAIARTTLAEGIRAKIASGFALLILVAVPFFWLTAEGDGTIKGRVQMFMTYSLGFTGFALALLTILFACRSLANEIESRQIYGIVSKPVPRWQILAGKWFGVMALNVVLLTLAGIGTYTGTRLILRQFKQDLSEKLVSHAGFTPQQADEAVAALDRIRGIGKTGAESPVVDAMMEATGIPRGQLVESLLRLPESFRVDLRRFDELRRQVLVARSVVSPELPDFTEQIEKRLGQLRQEGNLPTTMTERRIREEIRKELVSDFCTVPPGSLPRQWILKGPAPDTDREVITSVRYKILVAATLPKYVDPNTGGTLESESLLCRFGVGDPQTANFYAIQDVPTIRTFREFEVPMGIDVVEKDGTIRVVFANIDPRGADAVFDFPDAIQILRQEGTFEKNLFQTCLAILVPLACLASFGVCASTFLGFRVGVLIVMCLFLISAAMGFVREALAATEEYAPPNPGLAFEIRRTTVDTIDWILSVGDIDPLDSLMDGRAIGWRSLWTIFWKFDLLKGGIVMLIAVFVFRRRELAAVVV